MKDLVPQNPVEALLPVQEEGSDVVPLWCSSLDPQGQRVRDVVRGGSFPCTPELWGHPILAPPFNSRVFVAAAGPAGIEDAHEGQGPDVKR